MRNWIDPMAAQIFIDGEAGTTGLQIRERLGARDDITLIQLPDDVRKDADARADAINASDLTILCLPDDAAREAVALVANNKTHVIDASTAHRNLDDWVYGFPEMTEGQADAIRAARFVTNPGCYPTGAIALIRPLVEAGMIPKDFPLTVNAVSGYSGGGRQMIEDFEDSGSATHIEAAVRPYATALEHKHAPEIHRYSLLDHRPLFTPTVARYRQGMIVQVPLQLWALPGKPDLATVHSCLASFYAGQRFVHVTPLEESLATPHLDPEALNNTNDMALCVFGNEAEGQAVLVALLDNLGKGASGAAVQNMNLMLGLDESLT